MSLGELLVVAIVALLVTKPGDIPVLLKQLGSIKNYFTKIKNDLYAEITSGTNLNDDLLTDNVEEMNFYLEKILGVEGKYDGKYELSEIKSRYRKLMKEQISKELLKE